MNGKQSILLLLLLAALPGCIPRHMTAVWKADRVLPVRYNHILVVAIVPERDSLLRKRIESAMTAELQSIGYNAMSAFDLFGANGLSRPGEENTYLRLCDNGIDAVLTLALLPKTDQTYRLESKAMLQPHRYYYDRIWNYRDLPGKDAQNDHARFWESILFDLGTLEAILTVRTEPFAVDRMEKTSSGLANRITRTMLKEKILKKQRPALKPF